MEVENITIGERVKKYRLTKNFSQQYVAQKIGITQKAYSKLENNEIKMGVDTLIRIAEALETPISNFFDESNKPVVNDFSSRTGGDNIIYKTIQSEEIEKMYKKILEAKDEVINAKENEILALKSIIALKKKS
jgi:transcriptional regulator with XRE-family HTH domain